MKTRLRAWVGASTISLGACVPTQPPSGAETTGDSSGSDESPGDGDPGDGDPGDGDPGDGDPGDGDGDGDPGDVPDCTRATTWDGADAALSPEPGCAIDCDPSWPPSLALEWTLDLDMFEASYRPIELLRRPTGELLCVANRAPEPQLVSTVTLDGQIESSFEAVEIPGRVTHAAVGADGTLYLARTWSGFGGDEASVHAYDVDDQHLWTAQLPGATLSAIAATGDGVAAVVRDAGLDWHLRAWTSDGALAWEVETLDAGLGDGPRAAASSGGVFAVANTEAWARHDPSGAALPAAPQGFASFMDPPSLALIADDRLIQAGTLIGPENFDAYVAWQSPVEREILRTYAHGVTICEDAAPTTSAERILDAAALDDGSLVLVGAVAAPDPDRPLVLHLDAAGDPIGADVGLWQGVALAVVGGPDGSALVLAIDTGRPEPRYQLRKYSL